MMNNPKTVFILGAGTSKTYGYPLGDELRKQILSVYKDSLINLQRKVEFRDFINESNAFIEHFRKSGDKSIDLFLSKFSEYRIPGIKAILYRIFEAERQSIFLDEIYFRNKRNLDNSIIDDWMWYLYNRLTSSLNRVTSYKKINFNNIAFITFNYDRSLEHFFYERLENGFNYKVINGSPTEVISTLQFEHVYGQIAYLPWQNNNNFLSYDGFDFNYGIVDEYVDNIKIIGERTNENMEDIFDLIKNANKIMFLGFGYDETNLKTLGFPQILSSNQQVCGTALDFMNEEIEEIKAKFYIPGPNQPATNKHMINIENCNCTTLLRKYFR